MIDTLLQKAKLDIVIDDQASNTGPLLQKHITSHKNSGLRLTRSEEFLDGTHDIFDILVLQNAEPSKTGE